MSAVAMQIVTLLESPVISLKNTIAEYQKRKEEKKRLKTQLTDSLQVEIKEYESLTEEMAKFGQTVLDIIQNIGEIPTPNQLLRFVDCVSQAPRLLAKEVILFIHLARACKDISMYEGFMDSMKTTNRFMYDFIREMGAIYVEKDTVSIDTRFFHFIFMHKKEILKGVNISKVDKKETELLLKKLDAILVGLKRRAIRRYINKVTVKKWNAGYIQLTKVVTEDMIIDSGGMDLSALNDFMPSGLKELTDFLNRPPPLQ
jgi:hypothetical protein